MPKRNGRKPQTRRWNVVRPFQRPLTAVLPHQANTRILVPKRDKLNFPPP